jgi:hypothetical protein
MNGARARVGAGLRNLLDRFLDPRLELAMATSPATKASLRSLFFAYRDAVEAGRPLPPPEHAGLRVFSQVDEDGILLFLLAAIGIDRGRFVDIGAGDCLTASNCANLALNFGFHGLFVDGDPERISFGRRLYSSHPDSKEYPPQTVQAFVTRENVDAIIGEAGFEGEIDVLSIDIDGNDHWIWRAITRVQPRIVVIEAHVEHGLEDVSSPYRPDFDWRHVNPGDPVGASPVALERIGKELGYRLVAGNRYGYNAFFLRADLGENLVPTIGPADLLRHDRNRRSDA